MDAKTNESFEALLRYMRDSRGFDFTGYKRTTLMRRVHHRMTQAGYDTYKQYLDVPQASSDEFSALFNTIPINIFRKDLRRRCDLRSQRLGQGCADLPSGSSAMPQHAYVHGRRNSA